MCADKTQLVTAYFMSVCVIAPCWDHMSAVRATAVLPSITATAVVAVAGLFVCCEHEIVPFTPSCASNNKRMRF